MANAKKVKKYKYFKDECEWTWQYDETSKALHEKKRDNQWNVHKKVESNVRCNEHVYKEKK